MTEPRTDVAERLLDIAFTMTAESGPAALSLRAVQRAAGVSAATAYWHFAGRAELLLAVGRRATARLADALDEATRRSANDGGSELAAVCAAYMQFAHDHPGLFRAVVQSSSIDEILSPSVEAQGGAGRAAFEILRRVVADETGLEEEERVIDAAIQVWATCHGLAALLMDSPLADLPISDQERLRRQQVEGALRSLAQNPADSRKRQSSELSPRRDAELVEDVAQVGFDGPRAERELRSDLP